MSRLRKELHTGSNKPCMSNGTAYMMIYTAVKERDGLIHGRLHNDDGESCAIGSYFDVNDETSLPSTLIDEVAAVNDSVPHMTMRQRKAYVARWLAWKLTQLGMPGFRTSRLARSTPR